jgi:uncharacterized protein (TIGR00251 family)
VSIIVLLGYASMSLVICIKVIPSSGRSSWSLNKQSELVCHVKSQPEKGMANRELLRNLAHALKIPQNAVEIISGQTSRKKRIKITLDISYNELLTLLGIEVPLLEQKKIF